MKVFLLALLPLVLCKCPGSPAAMHAMCNMTVDIHGGSCAQVKAEVLARVAGDGGWYDPHNRGVYTLLSDTDEFTEIKRLTGDKKYTDKMDFEFTNSKNASCLVIACSESQVTSMLDFSTNYCNLHDLYCGTAVGCKVVKGDFTFSEQQTKCTQSVAKDCLKA